MVHNLQGHSRTQTKQQPSVQQQYARMLKEYYSLSRKTVNTRENFRNVYCFTTNQMRDETAKDNHQTAALISHNLTQNNELALIFNFTVFSNTEIFLSRFRLW